MPVFFDSSAAAALLATPAYAAIVAFAAPAGCGPAERTSGPAVPELPAITTVT